MAIFYQDFGHKLRKKSGNPVVERKSRNRNEIAVFSLSDAEICNAIRSYEKRKASKKKKRKDLTVLAKTPRLDRFFRQNVQAATLNQWR